MIEQVQVLPVTEFCGDCYPDQMRSEWQIPGDTVSVSCFDGNLLVVHKREGRTTACGKSFKEMSLANFEMKR